MQPQHHHHQQPQQQPLNNQQQRMPPVPVPHHPPPQYPQQQHGSTSPQQSPVQYYQQPQPTMPLSPSMPNIPGQPYQMPMGQVPQPQMQMPLVSPPMRPPMPQMPQMPSLPQMPPTTSTSPGQPQPQYQQQYQQQQQQYQQYQQQPARNQMPPPPQQAPHQPQPQQQATNKPSIHPANIPSPLRIVEEEAARFRDGPYFMSQVLTRVIPPRCAVDVQIIDDGMSSARFIRPTCWNLPVSEELAEQTRIPMALSIQPFAQLPSHEPPVPVIDFGVRGPIRCNRCRGYINPHVAFVRGGRSWQCNLCGAVNEVPDEYYAALDATGRRVDLHLRPELRSGTVDIVAPSEYNLRPQTTSAHLLFLLDASRSAVQSGAFKAAVEAVRHVVKHPDARSTYSHLAIATFDRSLHFYNLRGDLKEPQAVVMTDLADPFLPIGPNALFFPINKPDGVDGNNVDKLLNGLLGLFSETRAVESCLGAAVTVAVEALKATGGRVYLFASALPNIGPGALRQRTEAGQSLDKVNPLLTPQGDFYSKLAQQATTNGVSVSMCLTPTAFIDMATIGQLSSHTGGSMLTFTRFTADAYGEQVREGVVMAVCKPFVYDCMARVRCGEGLQTTDYWGPCVPTAPGATARPDVQFGCLSCDQSFAVGLQYDGRLQENETTGIQCAILHTTATGQRRIRVINLALPCTRQSVDVFRSCDYEAMVSVMTKQAIPKMATTPLSQLTTAFMFSRVSQVLAAYRKVAASNVAASQLILPEELRLLPLFLLAVFKSAAFSPITATADARMAGVRLLLDLPNDLVFHHFYPRLYNLLSLTDVSPNGRAPLMRLSRESLDRQGLYLLENGLRMYIWVGDMVPAPILTNLFGVPQIGSINPHMKLPRLNNSLSAAVSNLIESIRLERVSSLSLTIIRQGIDQAAEADLLQSMLVEDGSPAGPSYADFLCRLHGQVQHDVSHMSSGSSLLADKSALLSFFH